MKLPELKKVLQDHFTDGLLVVVESGFSAPEGICGNFPFSNFPFSNFPFHLIRSLQQLIRRLDSGSPLCLPSKML